MTIGRNSGLRRRWAWPAAAVLSALIACGPASPPATPSLPPPPSPSPLVTATLPPASTATLGPEAWLTTHLRDVSAERLMADVQALASFPSRHVNHPANGQAADYIRRGFEAAGGTIQVDEDVFPLTFDGLETTQRNIVARIPGWDPDAGAVLLGAHYDSRTTDIHDAASPAPGANDNATGVALLLEIARLAANERPRATILLVAFTAEETGLQGSRHYLEGDRLDREGLRAMVAFDIVGNSAGAQAADRVRLFSAGPEGAPGRQLARWILGVAQRWTPGFQALIEEAIDRPGRYSDHVPFDEAGVPAVRAIEDLERTEWQHGPDDVPAHVDSAYLRRVTQLALAVAVELGDDPQAFLDP